MPQRRPSQRRYFCPWERFLSKYSRRRGILKDSVLWVRCVKLESCLSKRLLGILEGLTWIDDTFDGPPSPHGNTPAMDRISGSNCVVRRRPPTCSSNDHHYWKKTSLPGPNLSSGERAIYGWILDANPKGPSCHRLVTATARTWPPFVRPVPGDARRHCWSRWDQIGGRKVPKTHRVWS